MANMSYCAFENTYRAIVQLKGMIEEAQQEAGLDDFYLDLLTDEDKAKIVAALDLNEHEIRAWDSLAESMGELTEMMRLLAPEGVEELLAGTVHARR